MSLNNTTRGTKQQVAPQDVVFEIAFNSPTVNPKLPQDIELPVARRSLSFEQMLALQPTPRSLEYASREIPKPLAKRRRLARGRLEDLIEDRIVEKETADGWSV